MITKYFLFLEAFSSAEIIKDEKNSRGKYVRLIFMYKNEEIGDIDYSWDPDHILNIKPDIKGELYIAYVKTRVKLKGVGSKLVQRAIQDARELGLHKVTLKLPNYSSDTSGLRKFYEKLGFTYWGKVGNTEFMYLLI